MSTKILGKQVFTHVVAEPGTVAERLIKELATPHNGRFCRTVSRWEDSGEYGCLVSSVSISPVANERQIRSFVLLIGNPDSSSVPSDETYYLREVSYGAGARNFSLKYGKVHRNLSANSLRCAANQLAAVLCRGREWTNHAGKCITTPYGPESATSVRRSSAVIAE